MENYTRGENSLNLICSKCGSDTFKRGYSETLMGGPVNYRTYSCAKCGNKEKVKVTTPTTNKVCLGDNCEVVTKGD